MASKFEIFIGRKKRYRFHPKVGFGEINAASEAYKAKADAGVPRRGRMSKEI
jgi:uncharacterized protein YegP (UPF0339 family)